MVTTGQLGALALGLWPRLAILLPLGGCMYDLNTFDLCDRDPEGCMAIADDWPKIAGCTFSEKLQVEVGTGTKDFEHFAPLQVPVLHQGSTVQALDVRHLHVGVHIHNPDPIGGKFLTTFRAVEHLPTADNSGISVATFVLSKSLVGRVDGSLTRAGLRLLVYTVPLSISVEVRDQCGRIATHTHVVSN